MTFNDAVTLFDEGKPAHRDKYGDTHFFYADEDGQIRMASVTAPQNAIGYALDMADITAIDWRTADPTLMSSLYQSQRA